MFTIARQKICVTDLGTFVWTIWMTLGLLNSVALLIRFIVMICLLKDSGGSFKNSPDLPALFTAIDGAAAIVGVAVFLAFNEDLTKLRLWVKFTTMVIMLEAFITGVVALVALDIENGLASKIYKIVTIASSVLNGIFSVFLLLRSYYVGVSHAFLSHNWGTEIDYHRRVEVIRQQLLENNILPWLDDHEIMTGDQINKSIVHGIIRSNVVIFFVTQDFCAKVATNDIFNESCCFEFYLTLALKKRFILVTMDNFTRNSFQWNCPALTNAIDKATPMTSFFPDDQEMRDRQHPEQQLNHEEWVAMMINPENIQKLVKEIKKPAGGILQKVGNFFLNKESDYYSPILIHDTGFEPRYLADGYL